MVLKNKTMYELKASNCENRENDKQNRTGQNTIKKVGQKKNNNNKLK